MLNAQYFVNSNSTLSVVINSLSKSKNKIYISDGWVIGISNFDYDLDRNEEYYSCQFNNYDEKINKLLNS